MRGQEVSQPLLDKTAIVHNDSLRRGQPATGGFPDRTGMVAMKRARVMNRLSAYFTVAIFTCSFLFAPNAASQTIDFSGDTIREPVNVEFWKRQIQEGVEGIEIDSSKIIPRFTFYRPISFDSAIFKAIADFRCATFYGTAWYGSALFGDATFEDTANFGWATFAKGAWFYRATFHATSDFFEARFNGVSVFSEVTFEDTADFRFATFDTNASFGGAVFRDISDFFKATFRDWTSFRRTTFDSTANFRVAIFEGPVYFEKTSFENTANFCGATFDDTANFSEATFDSISVAVFARACFGKAADFRRVKFLGKQEFFGARLPDSMDFRHVTEIVHEIDFTYCLPSRKGAKCQIALEGSDISKLKLNMKLFHLSFPEETSVDTRLITATDTIDLLENRRLKVCFDPIVNTIVDSIMDTTVYPTHDQKLSIYEEVLKKLDNDGYMDSYEILDIEYRRFKDKHGGGLTYVGGWLQDWWWDYGYAPEKVFKKTLWIWFILSIINLALYHKLREGVYAIPFLDRWDYHRVSWLKRWVYYWLEVVTYTAIIFFGLKMDVAKFKTAALRSYPVLFFWLMVNYVVGLVCVGFIVNIIFTK